MPCRGICVTSAQLYFDVEEYFSSLEHREQFAAWLRNNGIPARNWWATRGQRMTAWALGIKSDWCGLAFVGNEIRVSNERDSLFKRDEAVIDRAYQLAQIYVGQLAQVQIITALTDMQLNPRDMQQQPDGSVTVRINLSATEVSTARLTIALDGSVKLITEGDTFEAGKRRLMLLLDQLAAQMRIEPSQEYETHRHTEQYEPLYQQQRL